MKKIDGGITAPRGFKAAGVAAQIKPSSTKKDCALIVSDVPASVAGTFTTNRFKSPAARWSQAICEKGHARGVFINSGNANTCTGEAGREDTRRTAAHLASRLGVTESEICICSTGVIGLPLPMDRLMAGVDASIAALSATSGHDAALAIMTTDTVPKETAVEISLSTGTVRIGAIAKGAGMIAPTMATMISIVTTDATVEPGVLAPLLRKVTDHSFNRVCIDNDMSTSDTLLCFANGQSGSAPLQPGSPDYAVFEDALTKVCQEMAQALVRDGEGVTKFVEIAVDGANSDDEARTIARAIATSDLVKTAFFGQDPNWGRIACAAGYSGVSFNPDDVSIWLGESQLMKKGAVAVYEEVDAAAVMKRPEFTVRVEVGNGPGTCLFWTCDLSYDYVKINADYRS